MVDPKSTQNRHKTDKPYQVPTKNRLEPLSELRLEYRHSIPQCSLGATILGLGAEQAQ